MLVAVLGGGLTILSVCRALKRTVIMVKDLSEGEGDLTQRLTITNRDELGILALGINSFVEKIQQMVTHIVGTADQLKSGSAEVASTLQETSASIEEVASTSNQFASTIQSVSADSRGIASLGENARDKTNTGAEQIKKTVSAMSQISEAVSGLGRQINGLDKQSEKIRSIVDIITSIAEQTNLLALNAAIEAARAGEQGRGFAVVAEDVRQLAEQSGKAAGEITDVIAEMRRVVEDTVALSRESSKKVTEGTSEVRQSGKMFEEISEIVQQLNKGVSDIASASEELSSGGERIAASSEEQSASVQQIEAAMEQVATSAQELHRLVKSFKV